MSAVRISSIEIAYRTVHTTADFIVSIYAPRRSLFCCLRFPSLFTNLGVNATTKSTLIILSTISEAYAHNVQAHTHVFATNNSIASMAHRWEMNGFRDAAGIKNKSTHTQQGKYFSERNHAQGTFSLFSPHFSDGMSEAARPRYCRSEHSQDGRVRNVKT